MNILINQQCAESSSILRRYVLENLPFGTKETSSLSPIIDDSRQCIFLSPFPGLAAKLSGCYPTVGHLVGCNVLRDMVYRMLLWRDS